MNANAWAQAKNILCIRLDTIGDVLMTEPAIRALKQGTPGRHITLLTSPAGAAVVPLIPEIDSCWIYEAPWLKATPPRGDCAPDVAMIERLQAGHFSAAVIFTVYSQNPLPAALLSYLAGIPVRLAHCHENPYQLLTDWVPDPEPEGGVRHEVRRQLDLVAAVGCRVADERMRIRIPASADRRVRALLGELGLGGEQPWIVVHPGATAASRRYAPGAFAEVVRRLVTDHGYRVLFTGTAGERELIETIQTAAGVPSAALVECLDLGEMAALLMRAPLLLANNTGPVHLAAAVGTPVVDLYALTNPQHTPWQVAHRVLNHDVPCKYCYKSICPEGHHNCLRLVEPGMVVQAVLDLRAETAPQRAAVEIAR